MCRAQNSHIHHILLKEIRGTLELPYLGTWAGPDARILCAFVSNTIQDLYASYHPNIVLIISHLLS
jgi:hypothetical protein